MNSAFSAHRICTVEAGTTCSNIQSYTHSPAADGNPSAPEQRLLGAQDLHRRGRLLREVDEAARVRDEARAHKLAHKDLCGTRGGVLSP